MTEQIRRASGRNVSENETEPDPKFDPNPANYTSDREGLLAKVDQNTGNMKKAAGRSIVVRFPDPIGKSGNHISVGEPD